MVIIWNNYGSLLISLYNYSLSLYNELYSKLYQIYKYCELYNELYKYCMNCIAKYISTASYNKHCARIV